jgi:hypothetical protein
MEGLFGVLWYGGVFVAGNWVHGSATVCDSCIFDARHASTQQTYLLQLSTVLTR